MKSPGPFSPGHAVCAFAAFLLMLFGHSARAEPGHDFAKWESGIAAFEQKDRTNPPPKNALLFIGSSGIRLWTTLASMVGEFVRQTPHLKYIETYQMVLGPDGKPRPELFILKGKKGINHRGQACSHARFFFAHH